MGTFHSNLQPTTHTKRLTITSVASCTSRYYRLLTFCVAFAKLRLPQRQLLSPGGIKLPEDHDRVALGDLPPKVEELPPCTFVDLLGSPHLHMPDPPPMCLPIHFAALTKLLLGGRRSNKEILRSSHRVGPIEPGTQKRDAYIAGHYVSYVQTWQTRGPSVHKTASAASERDN